MTSFFTSFRRFDWVTVALIFLILFVGLSAIYSVEFSRNDGNFLHVKKQLVALLIGFSLLLLMASINYRALESFLDFIYWGTVLLLIAVLIFSRDIRGTAGWFSFGGFNFQPVELTKFSLILALARYFERWSSLRFTFKAIAQSFLITAIPTILVILQPDFGGGFLLLAIWFIMLLIFGVRKRYLLILGGAALVILIFFWSLVFKDYQKNRIRIFLNPSVDPQGAGYNVNQSIIAIGSGRLMGRGLGFGTQSQLKFLPESQTDFIFAVIAEELGFVMAFFVLGIFGFLIYRFSKIALLARDDFSTFLVLGITVLFSIEFFINIGMNLGIFPVMGIAAPFLSYGGSSLLLHLFMVGVLLSVGKARGGLTI